MTIHFDDKGKIFTEIISKVAVLATIQTLTHLLHGFVYVRPGERIKDELAREQQFIAVTNATVFDAQGSALYRSKFLMINRDHIVWLIPDDEISSEPDAGGAE